MCIPIHSLEYNKLKDIFKNEIPEDVENNIKFFQDIDIEYLLNAKNNRGAYDKIMFSPKHIINKEWRGLWLHATGIDANLYMNWLYAGIVRKEYREYSLEYWYKQAHPKEKYVPYSIVMASKSLNNYLFK